jgi:polysaccharide chain length determinant protein (PEP-CTERM system associated)
MVDELEEQGSGEFDLQKYIGLARRRYLYFLGPLFLGWLAVWSASWLLPPRYVSSTLILVEQPTMPKDYVTPNVNDDLQERLQSITQQILSRTRLLHIIDQVALYTNDRTKVSPDEKVERMRKDIGIELVRDTRNQITAFNVSYTAGNPRVAQEVTSELTNLFISENLEVRQQQSEDTTQFLESQLEASRKTLADQEDKIRQFKGEHVGEMPTQLTSNVQILTGLQSQLQNEEDALNAARQQHVYLQTLSDQYRTLQNSSKSPDGTSATLPALDDQLEKLRAQLAELSSRYTDRHPDVRKVQEQIARAEKLRAQLVAGLGKPAATGSVDSSGAGQGDPSRASVMAPIQSQLQSNQVEIANREQSISALKRKIDAYQGRLNQEPIREQQLADLTRGYEQSKATYDDLLKKKNESKMATSMELLQQGERFRIVDPPSYPQKADFPNRLKFCAMGLGFGMVLGVICAGIFEKMDDRMHSASDIRKILPAAVLVEIPQIVSSTDVSVARKQAFLRWATTTVVFAAILAGSAFSYFRG